MYRIVAGLCVFLLMYYAWTELRKWKKFSDLEQKKEALRIRAKEIGIEEDIVLTEETVSEREREIHKIKAKENTNE